MIRSIIVALSMLALPASSMPADGAAKPKKLKLETLKKGPIPAEPGIGYILVRVGPKATDKDRPPSVAFMRVPEDGAKHFPEELTADKDFSRTISTSLNPGRSFGDSDGLGVYILTAYPGRWVLNAVQGTCLSLGTYAFDVRAGEVTDLGTILAAREDGKSHVPELSKAVLSKDLVEFGTMMNIVMSHAVYLKPPVAGAVAPTELGTLPVKPATLVSDYRMDNLCRGMINRAASLPAIGHQKPMTQAEAAAHFEKQRLDEEAAKGKK